MLLHSAKCQSALAPSAGICPSGAIHAPHSPCLRISRHEEADLAACVPLMQPVRVQRLPRVPVELVLVEDDANDEAMTLRGIERSGIRCNITVWRDGAEALRHLLGWQGLPPTVIVLDYRLPNLDGRRIVERLRAYEATRLIPVVVFSATNAGADLADCYRAGANSCVVKPDDPVEYMDRVASTVRYWVTINQGCEEDVAQTSTSVSL